jgi:ligand-binding sensor domain-containing protein
MNKLLRLIYLIVLLSLNFSCIEKKSSEKELNKSELVNISKKNTLKFTSGIRAIFQDSKGNYWFGSHNEGVAYYNGNSFEYFTTNEGLSDNQIRSIQEDKNGNIWFGTANGVSSYNGKTIKKYIAIENEALQSEWMKTDIDLWFNAGFKEGVYRYDGQKLSFLLFPKHKAITTSNMHSVTSLSKGKNNMIWFGTFSSVFGYNGNQFTVINDETLGLTEQSDKLHIRSILEDSQGRLWIGNNGIGVILKKGDSIIHFSKEQGKLIPMNEFETNIQNKQFNKNTGLQAVFAIEEDSDGNIWFGDRDTGAWKYDGKTLINYIIDYKLSTPMIWNIYKDNNNNLLFGMADKGVYKFNGNSFEKSF